MSKSIQKKAVMRPHDNVLMCLRDKEGNVKKLFRVNKLGNMILRSLRRIVKDPIDEGGQVRKGLWNYLAAYGLRISGITGSWENGLSFHNLITNTGFAADASRTNGAGGEAAFTFIAVGTGVTGANVADTALETETATSGLSRAAATASRVTTAVTNDTARLNKQFTVTGTVAVTESGVLNASSVGVLLCRQTFSAVNVVNGDTLDVTWDIAKS